MKSRESSSVVLIPIDPTYPRLERPSLARDSPPRVRPAPPRPDGPLITVALALLLNSLVGHAAFLALFAVLVVAEATRTGRGRAGLLLAVLSSVIVNDFLFPPLSMLHLTSPLAWARLGVSAVEGLLISSLLSMLQESRDRAAAWASRAQGYQVASKDSDSRSRLLLESSRQSRERFRVSIEEIKDYAIILLDRDGSVISWNAGAGRIFGYRTKDALRMDFSGFHGPRDREDGVPEAELEMAAAEGQHEAEGWRYREDGSRLWARVSITALRDESGSLRGFATVTRDITDLKQAEEALRLANDELERRVLDRTAELARANESLQSEVAERRRAEEALGRQTSLLRSILENMAEAVLITDEEGRVRPCNPAAERMFGLGPRGTTVAEWQVSGLVSVATSRGMTALDVPLARSFRGEEVNDAEVLIRRSGETEGRWALANGRPLRGTNGDRAGAVIVYRDVTERRRVAEELRAAKETAEAAGRAKDRFLASLSHELRTPLTPVLLAVSAMVDQPPKPEEVPDLMAMIGRNIELEARLIDDLLDLTRAASGRLSIRAERTDSHEALRRSLELCRSEVASAGLTLNLELSAARSFVEGDPLRLQQVFWNLIKNAVKFTPAGGSITIRSRNEPTSDASGSGSSLVFEVADTGIGIAPEALSKIFDPFEQGGASIQRRYGGLGLGLAISRELAVAHGGSLAAACEGGGPGATFTLRLPSVESPDTKAATPSRPAPGPTPLVILLVEDNPDTVRAMALLLNGSGHRVTTASNLAEAREAIEARDFDLLLSDIGLPDGSGLDLMREIQERPDRAGITGIAMSGFGSAEDVQVSREAGFAAHLTKPVTYRLLQATLLECLGPPGPTPSGRAAHVA